MRIAIADPPYFGCSRRYYSDHPECGIYDTIEGHEALINRLASQYHGFAVAMNSKDLQLLLPLFPDGIQVAAWHKPDGMASGGVTRSWEPVVYKPARKSHSRDSVMASMEKVGFMGAKPARWTVWVLELLGAKPDDDIVDLFPGSGRVTEVIQDWRDRERETVTIGLFATSSGDV